MVSLEILALVLTGLGLTASIVYYSNVLSNANKTQEMQLETRQAQLFSQYHLKYQEKDFQRDISEILYNWEWKNYNEFREKYGSGSGNMDAFSTWIRVMQFFDGIGVLVKSGLIDIELVSKIISETFTQLWEKSITAVEGGREYYNLPKTFEHVEYLYNELTRYKAEYNN